MTLQSLAVPQRLNTCLTWSVAGSSCELGFFVCRAFAEFPEDSLQVRFFFTMHFGVERGFLFTRVNCRRFGRVELDFEPAPA